MLYKLKLPSQIEQLLLVTHTLQLATVHVDGWHVPLLRVKFAEQEEQFISGAQARQLEILQKTQLLLDST